MFAGVTTSVRVHRLNQYNEVTLEAVSTSIKTDIEKHSRTFQDPSKMLSQVFQEVLAPYGVDLQLQRDMQIPQMLSQQDETDWCFVRRIANQFGMLIFTDSKALDIRISIGVVPFSQKTLPSNADLSWVEKDVANYWKVKQNIASQASAYEFLKKGFNVAELTIGVGHVAATSGRALVVTQSTITAIQGLLINRVLLTYIDGAYPPVSTLSNIPHGPEREGVTGQAPATPLQPSNRPTGPSIVVGEVLDVSGNDIQVLFNVDGPSAGVRWIPYCSFLNNDFYCMPDVGDTVFCYYENEGSVVCLGSKHINTTRTDFANPEEKVMTANNRMIKLKREGIDISANRRNTDGLESDQVKIILSDKTGIEISAAKEIKIYADKNIVIQANDLEAVQEQPLEWFEAGRKEAMTQFDSEQAAGEQRYVADGGNNSYNAGWDLLGTLSSNLIDGFVNDVAAPFQLIGTLGDLFSPPPAKPEPPPLTFEPISEYQIMLMGLQVCELALESGPSVLFTEAGIQIDAPKFRWFGFEKSNAYEGRLTAITDRNGNCTWLRYVNNTLTCMEFTSGQVLNFTYAAGKLASIQDVIGRTVRYRYDRDLLTEVEYPNGGVIHYSYTAEGYIADITDQNGHHYLHDEYDNEGRVTRQQLSSGQEYILLYDDSNRCNTFLDPLTGYRTVYHYNQDKLTTKIEYNDGSYEAFAYDERQNKIYIRDRRGHELHRLYNEKSLLVEERLPNGLITWFDYDENDNLIHQWDNAGRDQTFIYNAGGDPVEVSVAIDATHRRVLRFEYDALGRMTAIITPNGGKLVYSYADNQSEPVSFSTAEGAVFRYTYDGAGRRMSILNDRGEIHFSYNNLDYRTQITDALGNITKYTFDMLCNLTKIVRPNQYNPQLGDGEGTRFVYDEMDEQIQRIDPLGNVLATLRDASENVVKEINPNAYDPETGDGEGIRNEYDADDRKIRIIYPDGGVERIFYDPAGNIIKKVQPMDYAPASDDGPGYTYEYDEVNRLVQITAPNGTVEKRYVYDLRGNIIKLMDAAGYLAGDSDETRIGALYLYNQAGWLMEKREPVQKSIDGTVQYRLTEYRYDAAGNMVEERRYQDCQTAESAAGPVLSIFFAYDRDDRLVRVSDSTGAAVEYGYDSLNQRTKEKRRLSDGLYQVFHWKYDAAGRMVEQSSSIDREDGSRGFATTVYTYDKSGNIIRIQLPTGGEILREYDAADRLVSETHREKASGIQNRTLFSYDKAGNLVEITDNQGRRTVIEYDLLNRESRRIEKDGSVTRSFYDGNGRLAKVVRPNQYNAQADDGAGYQYTYDHRGQVLTVIGPDGHVLQTNTYDADGRLLQQLDGLQSGVEFSYDLAGNQVKIKTSGGATQELEYDARGNIVGVVDGNQNRTTYRLDNWGRIIGIVKADGSTEFYSYDCAGNMVSSTDGEGHTTRYEYGRAGKLTAIQDPTGERELYGYDAEGRLVRKTDRNGVTVSLATTSTALPCSKK